MSVSSQVIVVGGGLAGLSAAHTVLERGGRVVVIDKSAFLGGNSTKATSGINGALTRTQINKGIQDSPEAFYKDTAHGARELLREPIARVLTNESAPAVEWLQDAFGLDLSLLGRLGGHSFPRTHRGKERFPGMTITYALMERMEEICKKHPERARVISRARVTQLIRDSASGAVTGVRYERGGKTFTEHGPVVISAGGYGADFSKGSLIAEFRPDLIEKNLATTNGKHCTGDGVRLARAVGANLADMEQVQVHPTGLVDPSEPDAKVKFLAAEALRGCGGLLLDANGKRFVDELEHRDHVSGEMWKNKGPFRLVLNSAAAKEIHWHCLHYKGRGLMREMTGAELARDIGISASDLENTFSTYNEVARTKTCPFGKRFFANLPLKVDDTFFVATVTPVVHYTMGGLEITPDSECTDSATGKALPGLWAAGEVCGGVHGVNRLGGSSLLDCVVFGRKSGSSATRYMLNQLSQAVKKGGVGGGAAAPTRVEVNPANNSVTISWNGSGAETKQAAAAEAPAPSDSAAARPEGDFYDAGGETKSAAGGGGGGGGAKTYTMAEVAKHTTRDDCWVVVNGDVLNATSFLEDHPGGAKAIMLYAGKDASEEFNMLHKPDVVEKYAPEIVIGKLAPTSKL